MNEISSPSFNQAVEQLSSLPGIGKKTAVRLVLHLLNRTSEEVTAFGDAFSVLPQQINYCKSCFTITDTDYCSICINPNRATNSICVVENVLDVYAIENTNQFKGKYHVLGGIISPMEGIGPNDIKLNELFARVEQEKTEEPVVRYCQKCGAQNQEGSKFCTKCGNKISIS